MLTPLVLYELCGPAHHHSSTWLVDRCNTQPRAGKVYEWCWWNDSIVQIATAFSITHIRMDHEDWFALYGWPTPTVKQWRHLGGLTAVEMQSTNGVCVYVETVCPHGQHSHSLMMSCGASKNVTVCSGWWIDGSVWRWTGHASRQHWIASANTITCMQHNHLLDMITGFPGVISQGKSDSFIVEGTLSTLVGNS